MKLSEKQRTYLSRRNLSPDLTEGQTGPHLALMGIRAVLTAMVIDPQPLASWVGAGITGGVILLVLAVSLISVGYLRHAYRRYRRLVAEHEILAARLGGEPVDPWSELACHRLSLEHLLFTPNWMASLRPLDAWGWANTAVNAAWAVVLMLSGWHGLAAGLLIAFGSVMVVRHWHGRLCLCYLREIDRRDDPGLPGLMRTAA